MIYLFIYLFIYLSVYLSIYLYYFGIMCTDVCLEILEVQEKFGFLLFVSNNAASSIENKEQEGAGVFLLLCIYIAVPTNVTVTSKKRPPLYVN